MLDPHELIWVFCHDDHFEDKPHPYYDFDKQGTRAPRTKSPFRPLPSRRRAFISPSAAARMRPATYASKNIPFLHPPKERKNTSRSSTRGRVLAAGSGEVGLCLLEPFLEILLGNLPTCSLILQ